MAWRAPSRAPSRFHTSFGWRTPAIMALSALLVACDTSSGTIPSSKLSQLVLSESDLPGYSSFYKGAQVQLDNQGTNRSNAQRFGREGGWIIRLRPDDARTTGPLVVESRADLFKDAVGAQADFSAYQALLKGAPSSGHSVVAVSELGQETIAVTFIEAGGRPIRFYEIAWRERNATGSVTVEGFDGSITKDQAVALATKQESHMKGA